jgi:hypothetical protein
MKELIAIGVVPAQQPLSASGRPTRPELIDIQLSALTPDQVLDLLGQYGAWLEYVDGRVGEFRVRHNETEREARNVRARIRLGKRGGATDKSDAVTAHPEYQKADLKEFEAKARLELAEAVLRGGERSFATVSRAITSQGQDLVRGLREHNTQPKRRGRYGPPDV